MAANQNNKGTFSLKGMIAASQNSGKQKPGSAKQAAPSSGHKHVAATKAGNGTNIAEAIVKRDLLRIRSGSPGLRVGVAKQDLSNGQTFQGEMV